MPRSLCDESQRCPQNNPLLVITLCDQSNIFFNLPNCFKYLFLPERLCLECSEGLGLIEQSYVKQDRIGFVFGHNRFSILLIQIKPSSIHNKAVPVKNEGHGYVCLPSLHSSTHHLYNNFQRYLKPLGSSIICVIIHTTFIAYDLVFKWWTCTKTVIIVKLRKNYILYIHTNRSLKSQASIHIDQVLL